MAFLNNGEKKRKSFTFPESALYLTAKINEQGPGRTATQTCIPARRPELIGLFTLMPGGGGALEEEHPEGAGACRGRCLLLATSPVNNLEALCVLLYMTTLGLE